MFCWKRSENNRFFCVLPDAPVDAQETISDSYAADVHKPYWYSVVYFGNFGMYFGEILEYTFTTKNNNIPVAVYASTKTGKPSKTNFEWMGIGTNVTLAIPRTAGYCELVYFNIVPVELPKANFVGKSYYWLSKTYEVSGNQTVINCGGDLARWVYNGARLVYQKVPPNSRVNFTVVMDQTRSHLPFDFGLYYTGEKTIEYPNENNAQLVAKAAKSLTPTASLIIEDKEGGPLYVGLETDVIWNAKITVYVTISKLSK